MFERFTERARQVPVYAQEEAQALGHGFIGTEHLLLGLLREDEGLASRILDGLGVTIEEVRAQAAGIVGKGESAASGQIPFTPRAKKVLELSLREAISLGHDYIGTEHILLGIVRENEGVAASILRNLGADAETVRAEVLRCLGPHRIGRPPRRWQRHARRPRARTFGALAAARDEALDEGNYDLARKLLELEIEQRERAKAQPEEPEAGAA